MVVHEYGAWPSPISAHDVCAATVERRSPLAAGGTAYWCETRPEDDGRTCLVRSTPHGSEVVSAPGHDVRSLFHEYGGGAAAVAAGVVLYVEFDAQQVWCVRGAGEPRPITPPSDRRVRYAGFAIDLRRDAAFCLREDQRDADMEPVTSLVRLDLQGPNEDFGTLLVPGRARSRGAEDLRTAVDSPPDFVLDPVLSPDGTRIAWLSWNHPNMAWDGTRLHVADLDEAGDLHDPVVVAGGETEAIEEPAFLDGERLLFLSDRTGWSNFHVVELAGGRRAVHEDPHDYGVPRWVPSLHSYDLLPDGRIVSLRAVDGQSHLCLLDPATGDRTDLPTPLTRVLALRVLDERHALCLASSVERQVDVHLVDLGTATTTPLGGDPPADPAWVSRPELVAWSGVDGSRVTGFLYPPTNPDATPPQGSLPPLRVTLHGGPTSSAIPGHTPAVTYWTSRGFAVLDVNYAGSTGFGRAFRQRLEGSWGVADVADVVSGVEHLAATGRIDPRRTVISGGSAGGFTVLAALTSRDVFAAGASHFGVSDLSALARETHKLESRYLWRLVAPWPSGREVYDARSPLNHADRLTTPVILLQGTEDVVVPPSQAEAMASVARSRGAPLAVVVFDREGHGFRNPANRARALECELSFYAQVLGFPHEPGVEPVPVENLR